MEVLLICTGRVGVRKPGWQRAGGQDQGDQVVWGGEGLHVPSSLQESSREVSEHQHKDSAHALQRHEGLYFLV